MSYLSDILGAKVEPCERIELSCLVYETSVIPLYEQGKVEPVGGVEPPFQLYKGRVMPLYDTGRDTYSGRYRAGDAISCGESMWATGIEPAAIDK